MSPFLSRMVTTLPSSGLCAMGDHGTPKSEVTAPTTVETAVVAVSVTDERADEASCVQLDPGHMLEERE